MRKSFHLRKGLPDIKFHQKATICSSTSVTSARHSIYNPVSDAHLSHFRNLLGDSAVITNPNDLQPLNVDWMRRFVGASSLALKPSSTEQVSKIMEYCNINHLPIVPQGGNTGLVGGSVPVFDEIILSMSGMNEIESFEADSGVVITQAGVILETLDNYVGSAGYRIPLDLGAKGSCQIGGNVATNAGGSRFIRYGSLRASVLGLEAVLPDGRVLDTLTTLRKDNTGYDLKQLMIGSEGTLGIITRLAIACPMRSSSIDTVVVRVDQFEKVKLLLQMAKSKLGEILSAFEYLDDESLSLATTHLAHVSNPLPDEESNVTSGGGLVLIECSGSNAEHNREKLELFLETVMEDDLVSNGVIAENESQSSALWELRESLPEAVLKAGSGGTFKFDVSLPLDSFHLCVHEARARLRHLDDVWVAGWGHIGDGNLHLNIAVSNEGGKDEVSSLLMPWIYEFVSAHSGSVSAEHGLGVMKAGAIGYSKSPVAVDVMRTMKNVLDPNGICNPYKVLPPVS